MKRFLANAEVTLATGVWFAYLTVVFLAELCLALGYTTTGVAMHGTLVLLVVAWRVLGPSGAATNGLSVLVLVPLLRLLSLTIPGNAPSDAGLGLVAISMMFCAAILRRGTKPRAPHRRARGTISNGLVAGVALLGVPLGLLAAAMGVPAGLSTPAIDVAVFTATMYFLAGAAEEYIFRGVIQQVMQEAVGAPMAIVVATSAFASTYVGWLSLEAIGYAIGLGLFFGASAYMTRSTAAVMLSHGLLSATAVLVRA